VKANLLNFDLLAIIVLLLLMLFAVFQNHGQRSVSQDILFSQLLNLTLANFDGVIGLS